MTKIWINNLVAGDRLRVAGKIKQKVLRLLKKEKVEEAVIITLCDDEFIRQLNRQYRKKDCATDVLSFTMGEKGLLGDVVISLETARRQAKEYKCTLRQEIERLAEHGVLHLLGYTHKEMGLKQ